MGKKSAPPAPDYRGAAEAQAASDQSALANQTWANRPTQYTPWGNISWETSYGRDPGSGENVTQWSQHLNLTPESQAALDSQQRIQSYRSGLAESLLSRAGGEFGAPIQGGSTPFAGVPMYGQEARQSAEDAIYDRLSSRLDPQFEQREGDLEAKLRNQGLRPGDEAWDRAYGNLERARTDAYSNAMNQAVMGGGEEMQRQFGMDMQGASYQNTLRQAEIAEELQRRGWSLNEINAILSGQQVAQPNMPGFSGAGRAGATNYLGAAQMGHQANLDSFNAEQAAWQGLMSGVGSFFPFGF